jgi:hypothetical protein
MKPGHVILECLVALEFTITVVSWASQAWLGRRRQCLSFISSCHFTENMNLDSEFL